MTNEVVQDQAGPTGEGVEDLMFLEAMRALAGEVLGILTQAADLQVATTSGGSSREVGMERLLSQIARFRRRDLERTVRERKNHDQPRRKPPPRAMPKPIMMILSHQIL